VALAVVTMVIGNGIWIFSVDVVSHSSTETVTSDSHFMGTVNGLRKRFVA
jgi:hypothetical protein